MINNNPNPIRRAKIFFALLLVGVIGFGLGVTFRGGDYISRYEVETLFAQHAAMLEQLDSQASALSDAIASPYFDNAADIFRAIDNSVVSVSVMHQRMQFNRVIDSHSGGSGIIFHETDENIYIVTNYHVVQGAVSATVSLDDIRTAPARFVGGQHQSDLAVISVSRADLVAADITNYDVAVFGNSDNMEIGNFVIAVGNAYGEGKSATFGIISAQNKLITLDSGITLNVMQTDAAINPGNSGGPLVNTRGEVIGINTARLMTARSEGMGFAIPSNDAVIILNQFLQTGSIRTPFMGIVTALVTEEIRVHYGLDATGLLVQEVVSGFVAHQMGLRAGDVMTHFNGQILTSHQVLGELITQTGVGGNVRLTVMRNGQQIELTGTMTGRDNTDTNF